MGEYVVLSRKYRPQLFKDVVGQEAIVTTLRNAIRFNRLAQAYLFCGSRGTGKTTLARILAMTLNCPHRTAELEPCGSCSSCKEICSGSSMDMLEIDGASNRGIDDIRKINETVGYGSSLGSYKIFLIDEVHMLTKEAFNALLKTLEEPPSHVKFFFATTEPHKVPSTILSRCQKFQLNRIPQKQLVGKLKHIAQDLKLTVEDEAMDLIAMASEGGLRDAESIFDQIIAFQGEKISAQSVADLLGLMPKESFFLLDQAGHSGNLSAAFEISQEIFTQGKNIPHFVDELISHFRTLLLVQIGSKEHPSLQISPEYLQKYEISASLYSKEQCLANLDFLVKASQQLKSAPCLQVMLEAILLHILQSHRRLSIESLVQRLVDLEESIAKASQSTSLPTLNEKPSLEAASLKKTPAPAKNLPLKLAEEEEKKILASKPLPKAVQEPLDPINAKKDEPPTQPKGSATMKQSRVETLLQFAAVELEGTLKKK